MFQTYIVIPFSNILIFLTGHLWGNIGLAVIAMTILIKFVLLPLSYSTTKSQIAMKKLQPLMDDIRRNVSDKAEQTKRIMALYKEHNTNPLSGCLPLLIQLPIIIALYQVFLRGITLDPSMLYGFVRVPETVSNMFLGIDMTQKSIILAILAGVTQYFQLKLSPTMQDSKLPVVQGEQDMQGAMMENMQKTMKFTLPIMITVFAYLVPAAVALYWVVTNLFTIAQEWWVHRKLQKIA